MSIEDLILKYTPIIIAGIACFISWLAYLNSKKTPLQYKLSELSEALRTLEEIQTLHKENSTKFEILNIKAQKIKSNIYINNECKNLLREYLYLLEDGKCPDIYFTLLNEKITDIKSNLNK
ncbi:hypothetical protein [Francisella hispaniensis]|uniref:hypothetical protein n=1 Tax=Francisella hispaniensis TaxID=622488 RepID=UPI000300A46A|nr:hypothetical protein [Francisella hispaniensis]